MSDPSFFLLFSYKEVSLQEKTMILPSETKPVVPSAVKDVTGRSGVSTSISELETVAAKISLRWALTTFLRRAFLANEQICNQVNS